MKDATDEYQADSDHLGLFISGACSEDTNTSSRAGLIFKHYRCWCDREGYSDRERFNSTSFGRRMTERFDSGKDQYGKFYLGVSFVPYPEEIKSDEPKNEPNK